MNDFDSRKIRAFANKNNPPLSFKKPKEEKRIKKKTLSDNAIKINAMKVLTGKRSQGVAKTSSKRPRV